MRFFRHLTKLIPVLFLPIFSLFPQYSSFDSISPHPSAAGLASEGAGISEPGLNLTSNTSYLAGEKDTILEFGGLLSIQGQVSSPIHPGGIGFYLPLDEKSGWGFRGRSIYRSSFPGSTKSLNYQSQVFYSRKWGNSFTWSLGIGPGFGIRGFERSALKPTGTLNLGYQIGDFRFGLTSQHPGGRYEYKLYRNGDLLREINPPSLAFGVAYSLFPKLQIYMETKRIFYESSSFNLNEYENRPVFDRGIGAEWKTSAGVHLGVQEDSTWSIKAGVQMGGKYDSTGKNKRGTGLGYALSYSPHPYGKEFTFNIGVLDYSILSTKKGMDPESFLYMSLGYIWE
ncbi:MAG: hypothetical protein H7A24_06685 [Leptospiraceae bacterium]|nr:hypothetical protein [Leptospiraceae bacterium]MCP5511548.1 hypothetical protein [Leptospiraceae bacterium]